MKAGSLVGRMKVIGHMNTLAGLHIASVRHVTHLYPIEQYADNSVLIIQASIAAIFMFMTCLGGCWIACRKKNDYEAAELQK